MFADSPCRVLPRAGLREWCDAHKLFEPVSSHYAATSSSSSAPTALSSTSTFYTLELNDRLESHRRFRAIQIAALLERSPLYFATLLQNEQLVKTLLEAGGKCLLICFAINSFTVRQISWSQYHDSFRQLPIGSSSFLLLWL
jgi:hypothetical protein